jgi:Na+/melibiose symporter-like transporter
MIKREGKRMTTTTPAAHPLRARDYFALNAYWFALSFLWNAMAPLLLPTLVLRVAGETHKGSALGTLSALGLIIATIVQPVAGAWTDARVTRWGKRRPYIVGGTLFDVVFLLAMFCAGDYLVLLIAYALLQFVSNIAHGPYQAYLTDLVPDAQRGKVTSVKLVFEMVGAVATVLVIGTLIGAGQMFAVFLAIIFFLLLTMGLTARFVDERPFGGTIVDAKPRAEPKESFLKMIFHSRDFSLWLVSRLLILLSINLVRDYMLYFVNGVLQLSNPVIETRNLLAILTVAVVLVAYPAGALSDRWGRKPLVIFSGMLGTLGALALIFATTLPAVFVAGTLIGIGIGIFLSVNWAWGADLIPANAGGRLLGVSNIATAGAGVLAGAGGWMLDCFNAQAPNLGYTALFLIAALCYIAGTLIVIGVQDTKRKNEN